MISTAIDMYLETLAGYIFDDDRLVTYKWLSKELGLHVNLAKQILWQFSKEHEKRKDVLATFTLMGYLADGIYRVEVVKESDLSLAKVKYSKLTGEHLYSLQRSLPDIELLALCGPGDHRQAAIICKEIIPRKEEELRLLRWGSKFSEEKATLKSNEKTSKSIPKAVSTEPIKSKTEKTKINNIFGKINKDEKSKATKEQVPDTNAEEAVARGKKRQGSETLEVIGNKRQKRKSGGDSRGSSDESSGDEVEVLAVEIGDGHLENIAGPSPPKYKIVEGKRKVRKVVDKTSVDGNGFFVTKKEYVYESCSDVEELDAPKIEAPKKPQVALKANRKQASLFNFFKKS